ncbi:MAG: hypothetical protein P8Q14_04345 [Vicingaceae bacterium]|nr:hypothetical protein [Vicingaceae bacterium]
MKAKKLLVVLFIGAALFSCKKDEDTPAPAATPTTTPTPTPAPGNTTGNAQPSFVGADASLWAVNSISNTSVAGQTITTTIGTGVGIFLDGSSNFVDVGALQLNGNALTLNPNNSYVFVPGTTMPLGITFNSVDWSVAGGNGFPAITKNVTIGFPTVSEITSSANVTKANGYTLSVNNVSGADSVLFLVGGINKTIPGNATSCTFSSNELSGLDDGATVVQVAAYISTNETLSGKVIYYGNETVQTKTTTVE